MDQNLNLRHYEEGAQKRDIVAIVAQLTAESRPTITDIVKLLEDALKSAYDRGVRHAQGKTRDAGRVISYD